MSILNEPMELFRWWCHVLACEENAFFASYWELWEVGGHLDTDAYQPGGSVHGDSIRSGLRVVTKNDLCACAGSALYCC